MEENYIRIPENDDSDISDDDNQTDKIAEMERTNKIMFEASVRLNSDLK